MGERTVGTYLKSIGRLERLEVPVKTSLLADTLGVSKSSVSGMLLRLSNKGLVNYTPYKGATLTESGSSLYLKATRCHRLWEVFLTQHLGIGWEDVFRDADVLEHATSDFVVERLAQFLGEPRTCPHGGLIPDAAGKMPEVHVVPLAQLKVGQRANIFSAVCEDNTKRLHYLTSLGLVPGAMINILRKAPFDDTITIEVDNSSNVVGSQTASLIMVELI